MEKLNYFFDYFKYLKNPISTLAFKFGLKKTCAVKIKNFDEIVDLKSINALNKLMFLLTNVKNDRMYDMIKYIKNIDDDAEFFLIDNIKFYNIHNTYFKKTHNDEFYGVPIYEYFYENDWDVINFKNRFVIDIGANAADRTLYFAKHGANVIGFEPVKHLYELGIENISINPNLKKKITFINKAIGGKNGKISIGNMDSTGAFVNQNDSYDVEVITVNDVLNDYDFPPDVLKMDCEGCEFEIILNQDLSMFNDIIFEHHAKFVGKDCNLLIEKLKKENFKIDTFLSADNFNEFGMIHAYK